MRTSPDPVKANSRFSKNRAAFSVYLPEAGWDELIWLGIGTSCVLEQLSNWCPLNRCLLRDPTEYLLLSLFPSPDDGNRSSFRNFVLSSYLESQTIDKVQNAVILNCNYEPNEPIFWAPYAHQQIS
jgi:hypothetical protein